MSAAYGVHFGTTSACLAVYKDGKTRVIANDAGDRVTPCIVAFTDHDQAVGASAKQGMIRNMQNTVCHVKQYLGRRCDDPVVNEFKKRSGASVIDNSGEPMFEVEYKEARKMFSPTHIAELIYKKMLETAQSHGGSGSQPSVLTVPLHVTPEQRKAIVNSATQAGFNILRIISEPAAAALAYDIGQADVNAICTVLVLRLGGVSVEASLLKVQNGMYQVIESQTSSAIGGHMFTEALVDYLAGEFKRQSRYNCRDNKRSMSKLYLAAENAKHTLSKLDQAHCAVESLYEGMDFNCNVTRARFESVCSDLVQKTIQHVLQLLSKANLDKSSVDQAVLSGGGAAMPLVVKSMSDMFADADVHSSINSDEVLAIGAAKQAGILLSLGDEDIKLNLADTKVDCLAKAVCIKTPGDNGPVYTPVFPRLSPLHARKHMDFTLGEGQHSLLLEVCELDESMKQPEANMLCKVVMSDLPASAIITSSFHLRRDGCLHITCTEPTSSRCESVTIETS